MADYSLRGIAPWHYATAPVFPGLSAGILLTVFGYGLFIAFCSLPGFPQSTTLGHWLPYLSDKPIGEDGYYMLLAAWNLGTTGHLTANFAEPVTGIQPFATFMYAGFARLISLLDVSVTDQRWWFLRTVLAGNICLFLAFCGVNRNIARRLFTADVREAAGGYAAVITATSFWLFRAFTYGLETGLYLLFLALCVLSWLDLHERERPSGAVRFGLMLGLTTLARIDFAVVAIIAVSLSIGLRRIRWSTALIAAAPAILVVSPWLVWVYLQTGTPVPSSGPAQSALISMATAPYRLAAAVSALVQALSPFIPVFTHSGAWIAGAALAILGMVTAALGYAHSYSGTTPIADRVSMRALIPWGIALCALVPIYTTFFWATHFYARYFAPLSLCGILLWTWFLARISKRYSPRARTAHVVASSVLVVLFAGAAVISLHTRRIGNSHSITAGVVEREMRRGRVGAFQSGVVGFFNQNVENLDGKVNFHVLPYVMKGDVTPYLATHPVDWIVDWPGYIDRYVSADFLRTHYAPCEFSIPNGLSVCYRIRSTTRP